MVHYPCQKVLFTCSDSALHLILFHPLRKDQILTIVSEVRGELNAYSSSCLDRRTKIVLLVKQSHTIWSPTAFKQRRHGTSLQMSCKRVIKQQRPPPTLMNMTWNWGDISILFWSSTGDRTERGPWFELMFRQGLPMRPQSRVTRMAA